MDTSSVAQQKDEQTSGPQNAPSKRQQKRERAAAKQEKHRLKKERAPRNEDNWMNHSDKQNSIFEKYYKAQNLFADEREWDTFIEALKNDLPTTFRVTGSKTTANDVNDVIREVHIPNLTGIEYEGSVVEPPSQIPWYPGGLAWQLDVHKNVVRKVPEFKRLQNFLVYETEVGNISRQEAVSMLPPLVLDVQPHHRVLDMCAAPGSKTAQILEALHASPTTSDLPASIPKGIVVANDSDYKRAGLLVHQSSRLPSPALLVTNVDASCYPNIQINDKGDVLTFDRILCDVPCSGDGTMRKNPVIWTRWGIGNGNGLHSLQLRILQRAMKMLAPGGRIVYSTCSINPIENEAVVAAALTASNEEYYLVDMSDALPELARSPGLTEWKVSLDKEGTAFDSSFETYWNSLSDSQKRENKLAETMFASSHNMQNLHLERSWRIYPHLQNTGGFFVAVLERSPSFLLPTPRKKPPKRTMEDARDTPDRVLDPEADAERHVKRARVDKMDEEILLDTEMIDAKPQAATELNAPGNEEPQIQNLKGKSKGKDDKQSTGGSYKEDPFSYVDPNHPEVLRCLTSMRIYSTEQLQEDESSFPRHNLFVRNANPTILRSLYLSNDLVKAVLTHNEPSRLRMISAGIKISTRQEGSHKAGPTSPEGPLHKYRVLSEAVPLVLPYMSPKDILHGNMNVLKVFIQRAYPLAKEFEEPWKDPLEQCEFGHHILQIDPHPEDDSEAVATKLTHPLIFPIWKSNVSLSLMLDKRAKSALSLRSFGEDLTINAGKKRGNDKSAANGDSVLDAGPTEANDAESGSNHGEVD